MEVHRLAYSISQQSTHPFAYHVTLIFRNGHLLAAEANKGWRHSEYRSLSKVPIGKRSRLTIYSLRFNKQGQLRNARPCDMCYDYLMKTGAVKTIYYSNEQGLIEKL